MELIKENVKVEWEQLGEGKCGDYDPDNPYDEEYLRFYISKQDDKGTWQQVENGSYCTLFPVSASDSEKETALQFIMYRIFDKVKEGKWIKKPAEELSWINPTWLE